MTKGRTQFAFCLSLFVCFLSAIFSLAQVSVLTQHNDNARTGQNLNETTLTPSNVNVSNFGKLFWRTVDGYIYAQPLYVPGLNIAGGTHNVVFVATEHNSVYAFDADDPKQTTPLWHVNLGTPVPSNDVAINAPGYCGSIASCPYDDLQPEIGITATPVIDPAAKVMYVVAHTKDTSNSTYYFWLHKLDLATGADVVPKVEITTTAPNDTFEPLFQLNRPALLLLNGNVYLAFGSAGDFGNWHGWVMEYDSNLTQLHVYDSTPADVQNFSPDESGGGGIFSCGQGLLTDGNYIYLFTGNGPFDANTGGQDFGDSAIRLRASDLNFNPTSGTDYFTPYNASYLGGVANLDLGAGGPLLIPGTTLMVGGGKDGVMRLLNTGNLGGFSPTLPNNDVQEWQATGAWIMGSPVFWNNQLYLWASGDVAKAWQFNGSTFPQAPTPSQTGNITSPSGESDTAPLSLSANGNQGGILWAATSKAGDPNKEAVPAVFYALDPTNLSHELWDSQQDAARDGVGIFAKFNPPTVANGKVYLGTFSGQLLVYGLNPPAPRDVAFVQATSQAPAGSTSQVTVSYPSNQNAGDLNVVAIGTADTTSAIASVTDTQGNTYTRAVGPTKGSGLQESIYYAKKIAGGANTVTVLFNPAANYPDVRIAEYSGADTTNPLDVVAGAQGSGQLANSGFATTKFSNELIFGADAVSNVTLWPGSPFISRLLSADSQVLEDHLVNVADSYNATAVVSPGANWVIQMAAFKAAVQPSSPPPPAGTFSLTASPSNATVNPGQSASYTVAVTSQNGFNGSVSLACSGAPSGAQCSFAPSAVAAAGSSTLNITTAAPSSARLMPLGGLGRLFAVWLLLPGITLAGWGWGGSFRRRLLNIVLTALLLALLAWQVACGGGGSSTTPPPPSGGTPSGTYTITVTGSSASAQTSTTVTLTVQ